MGHDRALCTVHFMICTIERSDNLECVCRGGGGFPEFH